MADLKQEIHRLVTENPVVLFIKGTPQFPQCGFSGRAVQVLKACGVKEFMYVNVLQQTPEFQAAVCDYASWPTWPQLYIRGEFIGGCDIMTEMAQAGELQQVLGDLAVPA
ncbi:MAG: Grx4 family monothiol glutaredoxin [Rhodocyclaceae bacterium]|nr:Grx4 family monothiol glutaredoxin [Rhodocyclaceae bacterium]